MNKYKLENFNFIDEILDEVTPVEQKKIEQRMLHADKIRKAMDAKGWNNKRLLQALGMKSPSIITKWLSGTHNFTQDTLIEIGDVLNIDFFDIQAPKIKLEFCFPYLENKTKGFDSYNSIDYIKNSKIINFSADLNKNKTEYQA